VKQPILAMSLLTATLAVSGIAYADEQSDKQAIIKAYRTMDAAFERKNLNQALSVYAPEFTSVDVDGKVENLAQIRQKNQQLLPHVRQIKTTREYKKIQIKGQTATVLGIGYLTVVVSDPKNPQVSATGNGVVHFQDTWKRTRGGWKTTNSRLLQENITVREQGIQTSIPPNNQVHQNRDYLQAYNLASDAINRCYDKRDLEACERINRIKNTLTGWCSQGDGYACSTFSNVTQLESSKLIEKRMRNMRELI